jgi:hypothetical protein
MARDGAIGRQLFSNVFSNRKVIESVKVNVSLDRNLFNVRSQAFSQGVIGL